MNFEDEPYVRKYPRKTVTNRLLGWEGRAVLDAMLGEFDAAGIFAIRGDAALCISAVTDIPIDVVRVGLARLTETDTWVVTARSITWPTYEEAQNCRRNDRIRQRESRRVRSAQSVTDVTSGHGKSQPVTPSHPPSLPPLLPPTHPPTQGERDPDTRAPDVPDVPGLEIIHPGPLQPSKRERELDAAAFALNRLMHKYPIDFEPTKANQARGHELGLSDEEIWQRWFECQGKPYPHGFDDPEAQFNRELAWAKADKEKHLFKTRADRDAFEMPGRERRAT